MKIKELKEILENLDDNKEIYIFIPEVKTLYIADDVSDNNGYLQINGV